VNKSTILHRRGEERREGKREERRGEESRGEERRGEERIKEGKRTREEKWREEERTTYRPKGNKCRKRGREGELVFSHLALNCVFGLEMRDLK
jgi:hypothetical protein